MNEDQILNSYVDGHRKYQWLLSKISGNLWYNPIPKRIGGRYSSPKGFLKQLEMGLKSNEPIVKVTYQTRRLSCDPAGDYLYGLYMDYEAEVFTKKKSFRK